MKIINQSYEILFFPENQINIIEKAGRTAYKSEDKITDDSAKQFVKMINDRNHEAVLEHSIMSVKFITDRGVSHEIVRHRLCSFTQESTRYCNYSKDKFDNQLTFIKPIGMEDKNRFIIWQTAMIQAEKYYLLLIDNKESPQQARSVLPNSLKTKIVVTANFREWKHIFQLRAISKAAHPQMRDLMVPLYNYCKETIPEIFNMGEIE